jgi:ankyrin repeat protein
MQWSKEFYLNKIKKEKLNVRVREKDNVLMIHVKDYEACLSLGEPTWGINKSKDEFEIYTQELKRIYIQLNFNRGFKSNDSIIRLRVDLNGEHCSPWLRDDLSGDKKLIKPFSFKKLPKHIIKEYLNLFSDQKAFHYTAIFGLTEFYDEYAIEKGIDPSFDKNQLAQSASSFGHIKYLKKLLKESRVNPGDNNNMAIGLAILNNENKVVKLLLKDKRVSTITESPRENLIVVASSWENLEILSMLLKDKRSDPTSDDNQALKYASDNNNAVIAKELISDFRVRDSITRSWVNLHIKNEEIKRIICKSCSLHMLSIVR